MSSTNKLLVLILILAALLRFAYLIELSPSPFFRHPVLDAGYYIAWAEKLAFGNFRFVPDHQGNPLYPYCLAFLFRFFGGNLFFVSALQHGLGVLTCLLIFWIGKDTFSPGVGLLAASLYAVYTPAIFYEGWLLSASLAAFLTATLLAFLLYARRQPGWSNWLLGGILSGFLILARPSLIPLGALFWTFSISRGPGGKPALKPFSFFLAGLLLVVLAHSFYYHSREKEWVLISPHGGENFYIGNNPQSNGTGNMPDFVRGSPSLQHEDFRKEAGRIGGHELSRIQASRFWLQKGFNFISSHPLHFLKLLILKILLFFSGTEFSDNYHLQFFRKEFAILKIPFDWRALAALSILGLAVAWKERKRFSLLYVFVLSYLISVALFFVTSRLRLPLAPLFCLFAAYTLNLIWTRLRKKDWVRFLATLGSSVLLFLILGWPTRGTPVYSFYVSAGEVYYRDGNYQKSLSYLREAQREAEKHFPEVKLRTYPLYLALGRACLGNGREKEAEAIFGRLLFAGIIPPAEAHFEIGNAYADSRLYLKAGEHYRMALQEKPDCFRALNNLGLSLKAEGRTGEAKKVLRSALEIKPDYASAHVNLGNIYFEEGEYKPAIEEFQSALKIDPGLAQLHLSLFECLRNLNRLSEARSEYYRCPPLIRRHLERQAKRRPGPAT